MGYPETSVIMAYLLVSGNFNSSFGMGYPETFTLVSSALNLVISIPRSEWATLKLRAWVAAFNEGLISIPRSEWATLKPSSPAEVRIFKADNGISIPRSEWATLKPDTLCPPGARPHISIPRSEWATLKRILA